MPRDAFEEDAEASKPRHRGKPKEDQEKLKLQQFLHLDRKVLRFFGVWDDRVESFGDLRQFVVHFYLSDDTLEVRETKKNNSGYLDFPVFVRRQRVPKHFISAPTGTGAADIPKSACLGASDLMVGRTISVFGRPILLYDADEATKKYYKAVYGVTEFPVVELPKAVTVVPEREIPPWDGIGSEEDTMQNVKQLIPKPPKQDFQRIMAFEGVVCAFFCLFPWKSCYPLFDLYISLYLYFSHSLLFFFPQIFRYKARLIDCLASDMKRRFIFCAFHATDTVSMFEPVDRFAFFFPFIFSYLYHLSLFFFFPSFSPSVMPVQ